MPHVSALYRYPVKGFTPERRDALEVGDDGRILGDRVLAFRFANAAKPEERDGLDYWPKSRGLALMDFPSLARLQLTWDGAAKRMSVTLEGEPLVEAGIDHAGRRRLCDAVASYVLGSSDGDRLRGEGRLPLELVGDGETSRFQDRPRGFVSLHGSASVAALDGAVAAPVDDRRFRSNVVIEGLGPWEELGWSGRVRIGEVVFTVQQSIGRCLAVHANPDTGERDARLLPTLTREFGQDAPTLGILLLPVGRGGTVRVGDEVRIGDALTAAQ
ncbi:MOSC domain-containing protein [Microbacterium album]|uniref:Molybdenum cofactor sulfurase related protein n=1 Tax=Microbacterium album TaxID=2053191 RepID=A0A917IEL7_9MICO|nr:MOSC domain-containing protein [Microbacterium album]GGH36157.1 molybdenum cofactor sulfurase related protein [Microbacterium album]